ncbi:MAG: hypothetical protein ACLQCU_08805 [Acidimicrobiales bacterium]
MSSAATIAGFAGLVLLLYAISAHDRAGTSDTATVILEGQAMAAGHLLLHGWALTFASYWTSDAAFYAVAVGLGGLRPGLLYAGPAVIAALVIAAGVFIAREARRGASALVGGAAVVAVLAFATPALAFYLVGRGFHVGTALYALVVFATLRRGRFGWGWALAVVLLALGMLGDLLLVAYAVVPLFLAGLVAALRQQRWRSGLAYVSAAAASLCAAGVARWLFVTLGAFTSRPALSLVSFRQMFTNLKNVPTYGADLIGLRNGLVNSGGVPLVLRAAHVVGAACLLACLLAALASLVIGVLRGRPRQPSAGDAELWRLDDVLLLAMLCSVVPFVVFAGPDGEGARYLIGSVVFAGVLTGRMVARVWSKLPTGWPVRGVAILGMVVSLGYAAGLGYALASPEPPSRVSSLAAWLEAHGLRSGIGDYWAASVTNVESSGAVTVRPVSAGGGEVRPMTSLSCASWYAGQHFQFLVYEIPHVAEVDMKTATRTYGAPKHVYVIGSYRVLVWGHRLTVASFPRESSAAFYGHKGLADPGKPHGGEL